MLDFIMLIIFAICCVVIIGLIHWCQKQIDLDE